MNSPVGFKTRSPFLTFLKESLNTLDRQPAGPGSQQLAQELSEQPRPKERGPESSDQQKVEKVIKVGLLLLLPGGNLAQQSPRG